MKFPWNFHEGFVPIAFLAVIWVLKVLDSKELGKLENYGKSSEYNLLPWLGWSFFLISLSLFVTYAYSVVTQIAEILEIPVIFVPKEIQEAAKQKNQ
jgi:hypothetical protein